MEIAAVAAEVGGKQSGETGGLEGDGRGAVAWLDGLRAAGLAVAELCMLACVSQKDVFCGFSDRQSDKTSQTSWDPEVSLSL